MHHPTCSCLPTESSRHWFAMRGESAERGFTTIELFTVIFVIAIGITLALPGYMNWNARYQLRQAATEIHTQLNVARMAAMNRNTTVSVGVAVTGGRVTIAATDTTGSQVLPTQSIMMAHVTNANVTGGGTVQFNSLGFRSSNGGVGNQTISVSNDQGLTYAVKVGAGGRATWCPMAACP